MTQRTQSAVLWALIVGHFLLALAFSVANPLGEAPDEADHWAYVVHIARERELPGAKVTQAKHPPLYHALAALAAAPSDPTNDFLRINPDVQLTPREGWSPNFFIHTAREEWPWTGGVLGFHLSRLLSVLLSTATVAAVYVLAQASLPRRTAVAMAAAAIVAFLPEFALVGSSVSNDSAAALLGTLGLWGGARIYRSGGRLRAAWWTPLALGFGFLAKVSTVALWPLVALAIVLGTAGKWRSVFHTWRRWLVTSIGVFGGALLIASPWLLRNWSLYGDPLGTEMVRQTVDLRTAPWSLGDTAWLLRGWFYSFWGKFGGAGHIPLPDSLYLVLALIMVAAAAGVMRLYLRRDWHEERRSLSWLLLAVAAVALGIWQYSLVALGTDQARLLFPAIGPLAILLAAGLLAWLPLRWAGRGAVAIGAAALALGIYSLVGVVVPAFAAPAQPPVEEWQQASAAAPVTFGELTLIGYKLVPEPVLFWQAGGAAPTQDWRTVLRVTAEDGSQVWEWRRSPGGGRWSTDRWPPGAVVRDAYTIQWPDWAPAGRYRVEVGLQPYDEDFALPLAGGIPLTNSDHPFYELGWLERP